MLSGAKSRLGNSEAYWEPFGEANRFENSEFSLFARSFTQTS